MTEEHKDPKNPEHVEERKGSGEKAGGDRALKAVDESPSKDRATDHVEQGSASVDDAESEDQDQDEDGEGEAGNELSGAKVDQESGAAVRDPCANIRNWKSVLVKSGMGSFLHPKVLREKVNLAMSKYGL